MFNHPLDLTHLIMSRDQIKAQLYKFYSKIKIPISDVVLTIFL